MADSLNMTAIRQQPLSVSYSRDKMFSLCRCYQQPAETLAFRAQPHDKKGFNGSCMVCDASRDLFRNSDCVGSVVSGDLCFSCDLCQFDAKVLHAGALDFNVHTSERERHTHTHTHTSALN